MSDEFKTAVEDEDVATVIRLLNDGLDPNARLHAEMTLLHYAVSSGTSEMAHLLVARGANVLAVDSMKKGVIHAAAERGQTWLVEKALGEGADIDGTWEWGGSPLHGAFRYPETVEYLLEHGARRDVRDQDGRTPEEAAREELEATRSMLDDDSDPLEIEDCEKMARVVALLGGQDAAPPASPLAAIVNKTGAAAARLAAEQPNSVLAGCVLEDGCVWLIPAEGEEIEVGEFCDYELFEEHEMAEGGAETRYGKLAAELSEHIATERLRIFDGLELASNFTVGAREHRG